MNDGNEQGLTRRDLFKNTGKIAAAAALAEQDYRSDKDLTGFEAFSEEALDDDESDSA